MKELNLLETAARFVNTTDSHIFLTGKAGTGKTTFLRNLAKQTHKNFLIVAPTGIAALNAGGVTIHSQFQLPLGTFLPDRTPSAEFSQDNQLYTQYTLTRKHPISSIRKQVLRSIELLIIDEVSMLRADLLDAIDYRMRSVRGNHSKSFGGVQVLMIGDLYQLPPIVKDHEWSHLRKFYHSIHFFEAKALQMEGFVSIELDKIFRQSDDVFIGLLNNLRNNKATQEDIRVLNTYYKSPEQIRDEKDVITITTHNYRADEINQLELKNLSGKSFFYEADIQNDFPESLYPLLARIELKVGAQIMFIKNDISGEGKYFNGKLATVSSLDNEGITVEMSDSKIEYKLSRYEWENKRYTVNSRSRELDEEVIGTFSQFPIKLAWAVTVHKSQGLTFDKAIVDVGSAFASGQVYVALSRLRSLDGLILRTRISNDAVSNDEKVVAFSSRKMEKEKLTDVLSEKQQYYLQNLLSQTFDFSIIQKEIDYIRKGEIAEGELDDESMKNALQLIEESFKKESDNTTKFRSLLLNWLQEGNTEKLLERLSSGREYYAEIFKSNIRTLFNHIEQIKQLGRKKGYLNQLMEIDQLLSKKLSDFIKSTETINAILQGREVERVDTQQIEKERQTWSQQATDFAAGNPLKNAKKKTPKSKKSAVKKEAKPDTVLLTLEMFKNKLPLEKIAEERGFMVSTIESHLAKAVEKGLLPLEDFMSNVELREIQSVMEETPEEGSKFFYTKLNGKYSYAKIGLARAILSR